MLVDQDVSGSLEVETVSGPIHSRSDGHGTGNWIVFSNSHATNLEIWDSQTAVLAKAGYRILRYDQRGHGRTPPAGGNLTFDRLVDDLFAVLDAHAVEHAILIGVSMGAVTVLRAAARSPQRADAVLAVDGQWRSPPTAAQLWSERSATVLDQGMNAIVEPTIKRWFTPATLAAKPPWLLRLQATIRGTTPEGYVGCAAAMQSYDFSTDYPQLRQPILYVAGAEDGSIPQVMQQMASATPQGRFVEIRDAGHLPHLEQPDAFNTIMLDFVSSLHLDNRSHEP